MSVILSVNGFFKDQASIEGHIKSLGLYEVNLDSIDKFKIRKTPIEFTEDILVINEILKINGRSLYDIEIYKTDFMFYNLISNNYSGQSLLRDGAKLLGVMFEAKPLLKPITNLVNQYDNMRGHIYDKTVRAEMEKRNEFEMLKDLKSLLDETIEQDGMLGMFIN